MERRLRHPIRWVFPKIRYVLGVFTGVVKAFSIGHFLVTIRLFRVERLMFKCSDHSDKVID